MNKKAMITGGERGIGRGIAFALADVGYDVAFSYYETCAPEVLYL